MFVFKGWLVIRLSFVIGAPNCWVWGLVSHSVRRRVLLEWQGDELFKRRAGPRQPSTALLLSVVCRTCLSYQTVRFLIRCSVLWAGVGVTPVVGLNKCLADLDFWKQKRRGRRKLWKQTPSSHVCSRPRMELCGPASASQHLPASKRLSQNQTTLPYGYLLVS